MDTLGGKGSNSQSVEFAESLKNSVVLALVS